VACELEAVDELVLAELIYDGFFQTLSPAKAVALLTCFFPHDRVNDVKSVVDEEMVAGIERIRTAARQVGEVTLAAKMNIEVGGRDHTLDEYVDSFKTSLVDVAHAWCNGASFPDVCALSPSMFPGSIIRNFRRLDEMLQQLVVAVRNIGDSDLEKTFVAGSELLHRGIIFSASLYLD
jgi:ATP-dependent RNA helicase DOB1